MLKKKEKKAERFGETNIIALRLGVKGIMDFHAEMARSCRHVQKTAWYCNYQSQRLGGATPS